MKKYVFLVLFTLIAFMTGCSNSSKKAPEPSGFLENNELLQPVLSEDDMHIFVYQNPNIDPTQYFAVMIDPIYVYQDPKHESPITHENIEKARLEIDAGLQQVISNKYEVTQTPGFGVMRVKIAITGAFVEKEGFKVWNVIPVSAAIKLASKATGLDSKNAVLVVELKFTDSKTGALIKEMVTVMSGEDFRQNENINEEFQKLAHTWAEHALPVL